MSKSSRTSLKSYGKQGTRKKRDAYKHLLKPYGFCCDINDRDNETRYDKHGPPISSSLTVLAPIQESPLLKFRFQSIEPFANAKRKNTKGQPKSKDWNLDGNPCVKTRGPLLWFQEDEIELAKHQFWSERQKAYNEEADRNAAIGEKKDTAGPRWYQDLSIPQMKQVLALGETMTADYEETITVRTRNALAVIGVTSTFFQIPPRIIKKLHSSTRLQPVEFLREIYRRAAGQYFEEEEYKNSYDCNERIILSAIAFLALPDTLVELNNRLPRIFEPVFPPKPIPPQTRVIRRGLYKSPYEEPLFMPPDWVTYKKRLDKWREKCKLVPRPRVILPELRGGKMNDSRIFEEEKEIVVYSKTNSAEFSHLRNRDEIDGGNIEKPFDLSVPTLPNGDKETFDFTISGLGENSGPVNYKICGTLKPPFPKRKSWLGEKDAHYIISGISEHEDPPKCPVTYVMTGISYVTPDNSDEQFLAELKLGDGSKRVYPAGRKNLSKNWQEWLHDADEEFLEVEREANRLIKSVEATMRLVIPGDRCDACCSCRQTRKTNLKMHATKTPYMVIESIAEGDNRSKYIVGSLAMHSPAPSPPESTVNLLEVVASKTNVEKKLVINGITNDSGETTYYISGLTEDMQHIPKTTVFKNQPTKSLRNIPQCACTIEQMFNEGKDPNDSGDDILQTKKKGICYGRKYRPKESPAFTCKEYPDDKSCRRNQFHNKLKRGMSPKTNGPYDTGNDGPSTAKKMFTLPVFAPCGDEDGMAVCGGTWGAKNILSPELVAAREAEAREILLAPPCGNTPGRSVCGGPWGTRNPSVKIRKFGEDEEEEEEDKEDEQEEGEPTLTKRELDKMAKEAAAEEKKLRNKQLKRDELCSERFGDEVTDAANPKRSTMEGPPAYCESDNPCDRMRTAPTVNPWENEYEKSLRLTKALLPSDDHKVIKKQAYSGAESTSKQRRRERGFKGAVRNHNLNEEGDKTGNNNKGNSKAAKDNVQVIYSGKQTTKDPPRLFDSNANSQQLDIKSQKFATKLVEKRAKDSVMENPKSGRLLEQDQVEVRNKDRKWKTTKEPSYKRKRVRSEKRNDGQNSASIKNYCADNRGKVRLRKDVNLKKSRHKCFKSHNDAKHKKMNFKPQAIVKEAKKWREYKVSPAVIPDEVRLPCQRDMVQSEKDSDNCECSDEEGTSVQARDRKEGPFGWRTKSQQELAREKTLVYLAEPNDPVKMIKVREGGRPCNCRENRNKKKILIYNIGGAVDIAEGRRGSQRPQLIEGVTYITPPQSPRNSSEYIPEYDIYESPYKMCDRKRSDKELKHINEISTLRSLSPTKKTNAELCPCRSESDENKNKNFAPKETEESTLKRNRWSAALKDEGLIDYFVSCQDAVPCWLRCAKFSKAGCCEKPKLLEVKRPVCECRYERRVVRREEEKKKWVDRQQRLKKAKKQPHLQVAGLSRPMKQDTKLIISSVKKVLQEGEFIPEPQYCVTGIAENYAMSPPQFVVSGIAMQSPIVTPEPSKPDILCMCGHKHWSLKDIVTQGNSSVRAKDEYPCRERKQNEEFTQKIVANKEDVISTDDSEPFVVYRSCCGAPEACSSGFDRSKQLIDRKKSKLAKDRDRKYLSNNRNGKESKELKFNAKKVSQGVDNKRKKGITKESVLKKANESQLTTMTRIEEHEKEILLPRNNTPENKDVTRINSVQSESNTESKLDLFELMKIELKKMAGQDFVLAKLPECWLIPQLKSWIDYRVGKQYSDSMKKELCDLSMKQWDMMQQTRKPSVPLPSLNLTPAEIAMMTYDSANEMRARIPIVQAKYYSELRQLRVSQARLYWPTMEFGTFPSLSFKQAYFTYMAAKEADGHVFRPW